MNRNANLSTTNRPANAGTEWFAQTLGGQCLDQTYPLASAIVRFAKPEAHI